MSAESDTAAVLIVEDHRAAREALAVLLSGAGHTVLQAATGGEALRIAREQTPDVALLDLGLPDMHGLDVLRTLREQPATQGIRVIALTGDDSEREACMAEGCAGFLTKPVSGQRLIDALSELLG